MTFRLGRRARLVVLLACAVAAAGGCADPPPSSSASGQAAYVRAVLSTDPSSLTFIGKTDGNSDLVANLLSEGLVQLDATLQYRPRLATSWTVTEDGREVVFHLRSGVLWHDGTPFSAEDVAFTVEKVRDPASEARSWLSQFEPVERVEVVDEQTIKVIYRSPHADFLEAWRLPILPRHRAGDQDLLTGPFSRHPVGCGPFRFVSYEPGREIVLESNPDYWEGPPKIGGIRLRILPEERTAYEALLRREVDILQVTPDFWRQAQASPEAARLAHFIYFRMSLWFIGWNLDGSNPFFTDPRVRRALEMALDREAFSRKVLAGLATPASGSYPPSSPWADRSLTPTAYDPVGAARLLDEAGWRDADGDGVREREGRPFRFTLLLAAGPQEIVERIAVWTQQSLVPLGVRMEIEKLEWRAFQERRRSHRFQAAMASWNLTPSPDQSEIYHSTSRETGLNYGGLADAEIDRLLESGRRTFDPAIRRTIYGRLQSRIRELAPVLPLFHFAVPVLHDARLQGITPSPLGLWMTAPGPRAWNWADGGGRAE